MSTIVTTYLRGTKNVFSLCNSQQKNGKVYIGCSGNIEERLRTHFRELKANQKTARISKDDRGPSNWQKDYNEYGEEAFECYLIETNISEENRSDRESYWINEYQSFTPEHGYNLNRGKLTPVPIPVIEGLPPKPSL